MYIKAKGNGNKKMKLREQNAASTLNKEGYHYSELNSLDISYIIAKCKVENLDVYAVMVYLKEMEK